MANAQNFWGLRPVRHFDGSPWNGATIRCYISASEGTAMYLGDPVALETAAADLPTDGKSMAVMPVASLTGATGQLILGVVTSFETTSTAETVYRVASTERYCQVCLANDIVFRIRDDGSGVPANTWQGMNASMVAGTSSTVTGLSGIGLDATTPATTQTFPLTILHLSDVEDNELLDYGQWDVIVNTPQLIATIAGRFVAVAAS